MLRAIARLQPVVFGLALLVLCAGWSPPPDDAQALFDDARFAWDEGEYVEALEGFQAVLDHDEGEQFFDDIALITGELYETVELSDDGENVRFSPDGQYAAYDRAHDDIVHTHIVDVSGDAPEEVDRFPGTDFAFAPDGPDGAYLHVSHTDAIDEATQRLQDAMQRQDRSAAQRYQRERAALIAEQTELRHRDVEAGTSTAYTHDGLTIDQPAFDTEQGHLYVVGMSHDQRDRTHIYRIDTPDDTPTRIHADTPGYRTNPQPVSGTSTVMYELDDEPPFPVINGPDDDESVALSGQIAIHSGDDELLFEGEKPVAADGGTMMGYLHTASDTNRVHARPLDSPDDARTLHETTESIDSPALSPDGTQLAFTKQPTISWQVYLVDTDNGAATQFSRDIQHELFPEFLDDDTLLAKMGEFRHRRAHVYDVATGDKHRIFHNNDIRTVSMEYEWDVAPSGDRVVLRADRDGNTISDEESVHMVDLTQRISMDALQDRIADQLASEQTLRDDAESMFAPMHDKVAEATQAINLTRLYEYQKALYDFDSKYFTEPGNRKASAYIYETLESFGYEPEKQWFKPNNRDSTANVIARLEGSEHPEVTYIYSAHFDSVLGSPGADDNSTGTAVLLEMARVLADKDLPATIIFASLTAEEAGLLGAQEFVRRADEEGLQVAGVVNNDMMGWTRHHRLDNTIRFSNYGIRDIQHASSILFSDLITYDSRYYRFTDAHVFFEAYGDVIGGIGSYPILGNPNYHQPTDRLETIDHRLVRAVAQSTTGVFMKLAHTPSMIRGLHVEQTDGAYTVRWDEPLESDITHYEVRYHTSDGDTVIEETDDRSVVLEAFDSDAPVAVRAVNDRDLPGWDWAEVVVE